MFSNLATLKSSQRQYSGYSTPRFHMSTILYCTVPLQAHSTNLHADISNKRVDARPNMLPGLSPVLLNPPQRQTVHSYRFIYVLHPAANFPLVFSRRDTPACFLNPFRTCVPRSTRCRRFYIISTYSTTTFLERNVSGPFSPFFTRSKEKSLTQFIANK